MKYIPTTLKKYEAPDNYAGEHYFDYYTTLGQCRDSDCLTRANFSALLEKLGGESKTVIVARSSHWAVGWVESIYIHESDSKALKLADELMKKYEGYPVIDEDTLCEVEDEEIKSTIKNYTDEFRNEICNLVGLEFDSLTKKEKQEIDTLIYQVMYEDEGYRGVEDAWVDAESIFRAVESKYNNLEELNITTLLRAALDIEVA